MLRSSQNIPQRAPNLLKFGPPGASMASAKVSSRKGVRIWVGWRSQKRNGGCEFVYVCLGLLARLVQHCRWVRLWAGLELSEFPPSLYLFPLYVCTMHVSSSLSGSVSKSSPEHTEVCRRDVSVDSYRFFLALPIPTCPEFITVPIRIPMPT